MTSNLIIQKKTPLHVPVPYRIPKIFPVCSTLDDFRGSYTAWFPSHDSEYGPIDLQPFNGTQKISRKHRKQLANCKCLTRSLSVYSQSNKMYSRFFTCVKYHIKNLWRIAEGDSSLIWSLRFDWNKYSNLCTSNFWNLLVCVHMNLSLKESCLKQGLKWTYQFFVYLFVLCLCLFQITPLLLSILKRNMIASIFTFIKRNFILENIYLVYFY